MSLFTPLLLSHQPGPIHFPTLRAGEGNSNPLQLFLPGESHGQRSLVVYSPWGHKESDVTDVINTHAHTQRAKEQKRFLYC